MSNKAIDKSDEDLMFNPEQIDGMSIMQISEAARNYFPNPSGDFTESQLDDLIADTEYIIHYLKQNEAELIDDDESNDFEYFHLITFLNNLNNDYSYRLNRVVIPPSTSFEENFDNPGKITESYIQRIEHFHNPLRTGRKSTNFRILSVLGTETLYSDGNKVTAVRFGLGFDPTRISKKSLKKSATSNTFQPLHNILYKKKIDLNIKAGERNDLINRLETAALETAQHAREIDDFTTNELCALIVTKIATIKNMFSYFESSLEDRDQIEHLISKIHMETIEAILSALDNYDYQI